MTSETKPLAGDELRKAVLTAAGWTVLQIDGRYSLRNPDGERHGYQGDFYLMQTEQEAWRIAPAVESSVDAALFMLQEMEGSLYYKNGWCVDLPPKPPTGKIEYRVAVWQLDNPAEAICRAWLEWKGRE